jgi:hypothetical protein
LAKKPVAREEKNISEELPVPPETFSASSRNFIPSRRLSSHLHLLPNRIVHPQFRYRSIDAGLNAVECKSLPDRAVLRAAMLDLSLCHCSLNF